MAAGGVATRAANTLRIARAKKTCARAFHVPGRPFFDACNAVCLKLFAETLSVGPQLVQDSKHKTNKQTFNTCVLYSAAGDVLLLGTKCCWAQNAG